MEYYGGDREEYLRYLTEEGQETDGYIDPDRTYMDPGSGFYKGLVDFLTAGETDDGWSYCLHSEYVKGNEQPAGIWVKGAKLPGEVLYLRSDQFGFSAPNGKKRVRAWDERHPYAAFMKQGGDKSFVADCIRDTRTLGGSFLWPLTCVRGRWKSWKSMYNIYRGVNQYMEDSVDLTLYEIGRFYDLLEKNPDMDDQAMCEQLTEEGRLLLRYMDRLEICKWLRHFQTFKGYVDTLCFHPFVDEEYRILDITKAELSWDEKEKMEYGFSSGFPVLDSGSAAGYRRSKRIAPIRDPERLWQILLNVRILTLRRTEKMEEIVHGERKKI